MTSIASPSPHTDTSAPRTDGGVARDRARLPPIYAGFWRRVAANTIDAAVVLAIGFACRELPSHPKSFVILVMMVTTSTAFVYTICLHARYGQTLGKMAVGIMVLRTDGGHIGWREAFWRSSVDLAFAAILIVNMVAVLAPTPAEQLVGSSWEGMEARLAHARTPIDHWIGRLSLFWFYSEVVTLLFNDKRRALHDFIAGTVVARTGTEALVRETQSWTGAPLTSRRILTVGVQFAGVIVASAVTMLVYVMGFAWFLTRTDAGASYGARRGLFGPRVTDIAPGVRLTRPDGWSIGPDGANGYSAKALGSHGDANIHVWAVPIDELPQGGGRDLAALGPAVAAQQRSRANKALQDTWAAGKDYYANYAMERSQVVDVGGRPWGEDWLVSREHGRSYVLINRYTVHGDAVIVVVDGYKAPPREPVELQGRDEVVAPVLHALEFSP